MDVKSQVSACNWTVLWMDHSAAGLHSSEACAMLAALSSKHCGAELLISMINMLKTSQPNLMSKLSRLCAGEREEAQHTGAVKHGFISETS